MAAIVLHNSINEGGGNIATLNGDRINISPDNIQNVNQHADLNQEWNEKKEVLHINKMSKYFCK